MLERPGALSLWARLGYGSRGIVYLLIGWFALLAALGGGGESKDSKAALSSLLHEPLGRLLLAVIALGLIGYALWRAIQSLADADRHGRDVRGLTVRGGLLASAVTHGLLAVFAVSLITGWSFGAGPNASGQEAPGGYQGWVAWLMGQPFGRWLVAAVGAIVIAAGLAQILKGWSGRYKRYLKMTDDKMRVAAPISAFGLVARGFVFLVIGGFLVYAGLTYDPDEARGLDGALEAIQSQPLGQWLYAVIALGLVAFGVYSMIEAIWRRIDS